MKTELRAVLRHSILSGGIVLTSVSVAICANQNDSNCDKDVQPSDELTTISGRVTATELSALPGRLPVQGAVIYLADPVVEPRDTDDVSVVLKDGQFSPTFPAVVEGHRLTIQWDDEENHLLYVHSPFIFPKTVPLKKTNEFTTQFPAARKFVVVKCNIHPGERLFATVVPRTVFAYSDKTGEFALRGNIPPGEYLLKARHPFHGNAEGKCTVTGKKAGYALLHLKWSSHPAVGED